MYAELLKHRSSQRSTGMAIGTPHLQERAQACHLARCERRGFVLQEGIGTARCHQRALEGTDGSTDVGKVERITISRIGDLEHLLVFRHNLEPFNQGSLRGNSHLRWVHHGHTGLLFHIRGAPVPELHVVQSGVVYRG